jgi:hypothetical protein
MNRVVLLHQRLGEMRHADEHQHDVHRREKPFTPDIHDLSSQRFERTRSSGRRSRVPHSFRCDRTRPPFRRASDLSGTVIAESICAPAADVFLRLVVEIGHGKPAPNARMPGAAHAIEFSAMPTIRPSALEQLGFTTGIMIDLSTCAPGGISNVIRYHELASVVRARRQPTPRPGFYRWRGRHRMRSPPLR